MGVPANIPALMLATHSFPLVAAETSSSDGNGFSGVTSHTVLLPSGVQPGDLLIVVFTTITLTVPGTHSFPGGWSTIVTGTNGTSRLSAAWMAAAGGETSITVTSSQSANSAHTAYRITGAADPDVRTPQASAVATGNSNAPDPANLSPTGGRQDFLWIACTGGQAINPYLAPADYTHILQDSFTGVSVASARRFANIAAEDPGPFAASGSNIWIAATVAIHPR
jgi:hypothetical protein